MKTSKTKIALAISLMMSGPVFANTFTNGGFESGDLTGWTGGGGFWNSSDGPAPMPAATYNGGTPNNTVVGPGTDPYTGLPTVFTGAHSARLNGDPTCYYGSSYCYLNNNSVSTLRQTVTNYTDSAIYFAWNAVLQGSHGLTDSDYFSLTLTDDTLGTTLVNRGYSSAGAIGGGTGSVTWTQYDTSQGAVFSAGWVTESIDTSAAIGHDFTLTMLASDCPYGGHWGYAYLDGFGAAPPKPGNVPEPATLALLGLGLLGLGAMRRSKNA